HPVFKVGDNRMFASMTSSGEVLHLTVKLTAEEREIAELLPFVSRARYVGRYSWITAEVTDEESLDAALGWVRESYWLKAPAESLRERGWEGLIVDPYQWNERAIAEWRRAGFEPVEERPADDEHTAPWLLIEFRGKLR